MSEVKVGQVWRRKKDGRGFRVEEVSKSYLDGRERARLTNSRGKKPGGPVLTSSMGRRFDLVKEAARDDS